MPVKDKKLGKYIEELEEGLFFIVGCARSGTTLLQAMLISGTEVAIPPETHFFRHVFMRRHEFGKLERDDNFNKILTHLFRVRYFQDLEVSPKSIVEKMKVTERSVRNLFLVMLDSYREKVGKQRIGEKTPQNIHHIPEILRTFPKARIINIVRDPRDTVNSLRKVQWSTPSIYGNVRRWKKCIKLHLKYSELVPKSSYINIRYEDLVKYPRKELKRVCNFLDLEYRDEMLDFYKRKELGFAHHECWKSNTKRPVSLSSIGKGIRELSRANIRLVEWMTYSEMTLLGYETIYRRSILGCLPIIWSATVHFCYIIRTAFKVLVKAGPRALIKIKPGT